jgi:hypothetical protein
MVYSFKGFVLYIDFNADRDVVFVSVRIRVWEGYESANRIWIIDRRVNVRGLCCNAFESWFTAGITNRNVSKRNSAWGLTNPQINFCDPLNLWHGPLLTFQFLLGPLDSSNKAVSIKLLLFLVWVRIRLGLCACDPAWSKIRNCSNLYGRYAFKGNPVLMLLIYREET